MGRPLAAGLRWALLLAPLLSLLPGLASASPRAPCRRWVWAGIDAGYGSLWRRFGPADTDRDGTFALGFRLGVAPHPRARIGLEARGWLLEASDLNDPTLGVSVSHAAAILEVHPRRDVPLYVKAGAAFYASYTNNHESKFGGHGHGWTAGLGYDVVRVKMVSVGPVVNYSWGSVEDVENSIEVTRDRRYEVIDLAVSMSAF